LALGLGASSVFRQHGLPCQEQGFSKFLLPRVLEEDWICFGSLFEIHG